LLNVNFLPIIEFFFNVGFYFIIRPKKNLFVSAYPTDRYFLPPTETFLRPLKKNHQFKPTGDESGWVLPRLSPQFIINHITKNHLQPLKTTDSSKKYTPAYIVFCKIILSFRIRNWCRPKLVQVNVLQMYVVYIK